MSQDKCGWQLCNADVVSVRDTPWGDLGVCKIHSEAPLFSDELIEEDREFLSWLKEATRMELVLSLNNVDDDWKVIAICRELKKRQ